MTRISVIVPTYNHARCLPACLNSVLVQSVPGVDIEVIVVDDGSTDNTEAVLAPYANRVTIVRQDNLGSQAARNRGFDESTGDFVFFCDADVVLRKGALGQLFRKLEDHREASYAYGGFRFGWKTFCSFPFSAQRLRRMNYIHTGALIRREHFPGFDVNIRRLQDWDLWLTMLHEGHCGVFVPDILADVRVDGASRIGSAWLPSFVYVMPWKKFPWVPRRVAAYEVARDVIAKKHHLDRVNTEGKIGRPSQIAIRAHVDVSVVIVTFREDASVLRACFSALQKSTGAVVETIVVDNASRIETRTLLAEILPNATYIANDMNRGFAAAVNEGMFLARGRYVLLLNPDTEIDSDVIRRMVAHMDEDSDVGVASAIIRYPDGRLQESIRRFPTLADQVVTLLKLPHVFKHLPVIDRYLMQDVDHETTQDVDSIMGAFMMIRRECIDCVGMLDERYYIWFEEVDYCHMAAEAGFKIRYYGDVSIVHHKGHTFSKLGTIRKQKWVRESMRRYFKKWHGVGAWLFLSALAPVFIVLAYVAAFLKRG